MPNGLESDEQCSSLMKIFWSLLSPMRARISVSQQLDRLDSFFFLYVYLCGDAFALVSCMLSGTMYCNDCMECHISNINGLCWAKIIWEKMSYHFSHSVFWKKKSQTFGTNSNQNLNLSHCILFFIYHIHVLNLQKDNS